MNKDGPPKGGFTYGVPVPLELDLMAEAAWTADPLNNRVIGRLVLQSPGAKTMSLYFASFQLAGEAQVIVRAPGDTHTLEAFTAHSKQGDAGKLHTPVVPGDEVEIEFIGTATEKSASRMQLAHVIHGRMDLFGSESSKRGGDPFDCLIDVRCPLGDDWVDQRRATVMFLRESGHGCSGVMLNNTANDLTPYVQIARHCFEGPPANPNAWVFYFNYERTGCNSGTVDWSQTVTGATSVAHDDEGDFHLLELNSTPPASFNVYYAGWDNSGATPDHGVIIGHPETVYATTMPDRVAYKKIASYSTTTTDYYPSLDKPVWVMDIDQGGVFGGLSGGPVFNEDKRVIGNFIVGDGDCSSEMTAYSGKVSENWDGTYGHRLKDWLDPLVSNTTHLNGTYRPLTLHVKMNLQGAYDNGSGLMRADLDSIPYTEPYTGSGYTHMLNGGGETADSLVLFASGNARIVDWVVVELRHAATPTQVFATRSALLRRDGVVAELDGSTNGIVFEGLPTSQCHVAVRHRNHLGAMTAAAIDLTLFTGTVDFTDTTVTPLYGTKAEFFTGSASCLWMGDVIPDGIVKYTGTNNDRDPILTRVGISPPTATKTGYWPEDTNLDYVVKYLGADNDRDPILSVVGGSTTATRSEQLP